MFFKRIGFPEEGELVLCSVTKVQSHSVFVRLDEFEKGGMIHISEVSPGRIRNIRDFVKEDKVVVCQVLRVNRDRGYIDLSLRRVSTSAMIEKLNEYKQEEKAEKLLETVGREFKTDLKGMYELVGKKAIEKYSTLYNFFQSMVFKGKSVVEELDIQKNYKEALYKVAVEKIKPVEVKVSGILTLRTYAEDGIVALKKILQELEKAGTKVQYLGAPKYKVEVVSKNYKTAESILKIALDKALEQSRKLGVEGEFLKSAS